MTKRMIIMALAGGLWLAACSGGETPSDQKQETAYKTQADDPSPPVEKIARDNPQALEITAMHLPDTDAYCTFMQAGQEFVFDDPDTWRFVFTTELEGDPQLGQMKINGDILTFNEETSSTDEDGIETWQYRSVDRGILVELKLRETDSGPEHTDYTGTIAIIEPTETERMGVEGSCGV